LRRALIAGGKLFKITGIVRCAGSLVPDRAIWFIPVPVLADPLATVACSYYTFRKEQEKS
jgi:hypothetical protein